MFFEIHLNLLPHMAWNFLANSLPIKEANLMIKFLRMGLRNYWGRWLLPQWFESNFKINWWEDARIRTNCKIFLQQKHRTRTSMTKINIFTSLMQRPLSNSQRWPRSGLIKEISAYWGMRLMKSGANILISTTLISAKSSPCSKKKEKLMNYPHRNRMLKRGKKINPNKWSKLKEKCR